jgi:hypothetical protein
MSLNNFISRLQKVKRTGDNKFMACCPAHNDKTASLTVSELPDGRVLINCFAGCDTYSILKSVGLDWQDVMPENNLGEFKKKDRVLYPSEALELVKFETQVVCMIAYDAKKKGFVDQEMMSRLTKSIKLINSAVEATK